MNLPSFCTSIYIQQKAEFTSCRRDSSSTTNGMFVGAYEPPYMHHLYAISNLRQYRSLPPFSKPCRCFPVGTHKHETHHNRCKILGRSQVMMFLSYEMSTSRAKRCAMGSSKSWLTSRRNQPWPIVRSMTCMA